MYFAHWSRMPKSRTEIRKRLATACWTTVVDANKDKFDAGCFAKRFTCMILCSMTSGSFFSGTTNCKLSVSQHSSDQRPAFLAHVSSARGPQPTPTYPTSHTPKPRPRVCPAADPPHSHDSAVSHKLPGQSPRARLALCVLGMPPSPHLPPPHIQIFEPSETSQCAAWRAIAVVIRPPKNTSHNTSVGWPPKRSATIGMCSKTSDNCDRRIDQPTPARGPRRLPQRNNGPQRGKALRCLKHPRPMACKLRMRRLQSVRVRGGAAQSV